MMKLEKWFPLLLVLTSFAACRAQHTKTDGGSVSFWLTTGDSSLVLSKQADIAFGTASANATTIDVDTARTFQSIDGFGFALTGGSAYVINHLPSAEKQRLLDELFGSGESSLHLNYLRISIGASDLNAAVYTYDDAPAGTTDEQLTRFNLGQDTVDVIPLLKAILAINSNIKILGSPWTAPLWMKDNGNSIGGSLQPKYYDAYARYFVKYIQQMQANGIPIEAITPQNEPLFGGNNPSMVVTAEQERDFIKGYLGPAFRSAGITTKVIVYDHNCDRPDYPITILNDPEARNFVYGSAFHLYGGEISALSSVHNAHPDKALYFTEQWTGARESFSGTLKWHMKNVIIGTLNNWGRAVIEWNLASDPHFSPHTAGGCTECKGALTVGTAVTRNVSYYIVGHASRFIPPGSVRIGSTSVGTITTSAFKTPGGKFVLLAVNDNSSATTFQIRAGGKAASTTLPGGAIATLTW